MQRIFTCDDMQNTTFTPDKLLKSLVDGTPLYIVICRS